MALPGRIEVICDDCGRPSTFVANLQGTVQDCAHCGAFVDVPKVGKDDIADRKARGGAARFVPGTEFEPVWFTPAEDFGRAWRWRGFKDQGRLEVIPPGIRFTGGQRYLDIREIKNVALTKEPLPWLTFSVTSGLMVLVAVAGGSRSEPLALTVGILVFTWLLLLLIIAAHNARKWIKVEYIDDGHLRHAYFSDGFILISGGKIGHFVQVLALLSIQISRWAKRLRHWFSGEGKRSPEPGSENGSQADKAIGCGGMMGGTDLLYEAIRQCAQGRS